MLLPTSLSEWLPEDHLAYFISDAVEAMDLDAFYGRYEGDGRRRQPFDPRMMVQGADLRLRERRIFFAQRLPALSEDIAFRVALGEQLSSAPHDRGVRQLHLQEFLALFRAGGPRVRKQAGRGEAGRRRG